MSASPDASSHMQTMRQQIEEDRESRRLQSEEDKWRAERYKVDRRKESRRQAELYEVRHLENQSDSESVSDSDVKGNRGSMLFGSSELFGHGPFVGTYSST